MASVKRSFKETLALLFPTAHVGKKANCVNGNENAQDEQIKFGGDLTRKLQYQKKYCTH